MAYSSRTLQTLHEEHLQTLKIMAALEGALRRHRAAESQPPSSDAIAGLLADLIGWAETEIGPHFGVEEDELLPRLAEAGEGALGDLLRTEHGHIVTLAHRVAALARAARADGFTPARWAEFARLGADLAAQVTDHVTKEEDGLLPALEGLLSEDDDARIARARSARP